MGFYFLVIQNTSSRVEFSKNPDKRFRICRPQIVEDEFDGVGALGILDIFRCNTDPIADFCTCPGRIEGRWNVRVVKVSVEERVMKINILIHRSGRRIRGKRCVDIHRLGFAEVGVV